MQTALSDVAHIRTAVVFRTQMPRASPEGNVRALAIRDLVASRPLSWNELPRVAVPDRYLSHCLRPGDVVMPSRGDHYKAWLFDETEAPVLPVGQLNVIMPTAGLDARYLVWHLNQRSTQARISLLTTGTSIKALTKAALLGLEVEVPSHAMQRQIAELDRTTRRIGAIRHRLNTLNEIETEYLTGQVLQKGGRHA